MQIHNFSPKGNTVAMDVTTSTSRETLTSPGSYGGVLRVTNLGPNKAFINLGGDSVAAVIPVDGTPANAMCILSGETAYLDLAPTHSHIAAISAAAESATLYLTTGEGGN